MTNLSRKVIEKIDEEGTRDIIKQGVLLEEKFVSVISQRVNEVIDSEKIPESDKKSIKTVLDALVRDSQKHEELFKKIIAKY